MQGRLPKKSAHYGNLQEICKAVFRGSDIIGQLIHYMEPANRCWEAFNLARLVYDVAEGLRASGVVRVETRFHCDGQAGFVLGNPAEIRTMLLNICTNAVESMEGKDGKLTIELSNDTSFRRSMEDGDSGRRHVVVTIIDNGCGMNRATLERVFEPFFTTKPGVRGGMGLAVARAVVARHSGTISVESEVGQGSSFLITLPEVDAFKTPQAVEATTHNAREGRIVCLPH
jgi:signal transduction histidine kinase